MKTTERWTYKGLVLLSCGKKLGHSWMDADKKELLFSAKRGRYSIGSVYTVEVERKDEGGVSLFGTPKFHERGVPQEDWQLESRAAEAKIERDRAEKRAKADGGSIDDLTVAQIREMMRKQLPSQRTGTLAAVLTALGVRA